jgi:hypothetical protein
MATIHDYRQRVDRKLDFLEMEAAALEDDLHQTHEQVMLKYEGLKISMREALTTVKQKVKNYKSISDKQRKELIAKIDEVQINLAQGKIDSEKKIKEQTKILMANFKALDKELDQCLKEKSTEFTAHMLKASDRLQAEFAAMEIFFSVHQKKAKEIYHTNKEQLIHKLHEFNHKLGAINHSNIQKSLKFEKEFTKGLHSIKSAFLHLFE